jgi:hypothetical protein
MKSSNPLENQLRSWKPRQPSARLKAEIFGASGEPAAEFPTHLGAKWAWFAPVMGCLLVLTVISGSRSPHWNYANAAKEADWLSLAASNQSISAYIVSDFHSEQNSPELVEWSLPQQQQHPRPAGTFLLGKTNSLTR